MSNIDLLKESNENIPASSIVSLLSDIIIKNLMKLENIIKVIEFIKLMKLLNMEIAEHIMVYMNVLPIPLLENGKEVIGLNYN